ncbi:MAG: endonuclease/exonuclease/phosphatase family protein [Clostridiales bacterium]|nr:endonuclease/exonuclease/phosphatase family protein [Clostridiales bacterium]
MRVICYNIHSGTDKEKNPTLNEIIAYLKQQQSDIICLQEVLYSQYKKIKFRLRMDGIFAENVVDKEFGVCILTKYKIVAQNHVLLTSKKEQRGFAHIKVKINDDGYLNIINTHLGLDKYERVKQIDEILDFININLNGNIENLIGNIICGDFNEKNIYLNNFEDVSMKLNKDNIPTFLNSRIDYCFEDTNLNITLYEVDKVYMSDHFPIIVDFS